MHDFLQFVFDLLRRGIGLALAAAALAVVVITAVYIIFRIKNKEEKKFTLGRTVIILLLIGYASLLLFATLFRNTGGRYTEVNLHLFSAWREAWNCCSTQNWLNVMLNILLFVPLGFLLPLLARLFKKWYITIPLGFFCSLAIELIQYIFARGLFDVDDLFTNTLGCLLGYSIIMIILTIFSKEPKRIKKAVYYSASPLAFAAVIVFLLAFYNLKEYGNLQDAPMFTANTRGVDWTLDIELDESVPSVPIYRTEPLDKESCVKFAADFAERAGITLPDAYYYDNMITFANHSTGDFLHVYYYNQGYEYYIGKEIKIPSGEEISADVVRQLLEIHGITIPQNAEFSHTEGNHYTFTVTMSEIGDNISDGIIDCWFDDNGSLISITNNLKTYEFCKNETAISETEAYKLLKKGKFSSGGYFEHISPESVTITSCTLEYRDDSKGFRQPVYVFKLNLGEVTTNFTVLALK